MAMNSAMLVELICSFVFLTTCRFGTSCAKHVADLRKQISLLSSCPSFLCFWPNARLLEVFRSCVHRQLLRTWTVLTRRPGSQWLNCDPRQNHSAIAVPA
eukprot:3905054-Amphidinium_carterae.1